MNIITCYQTKNPCYQKGTPMTPVGIVVHSTGANNPNLCRYVDCPEQLGINRYGNHWNRADAKTLVHGAIGKDKNGRVAVVNTLPYTMAAWGVGGGKKGSYNYDPTGHIQFEMLEDDLASRTYLDEVLAAATAYCALLCREYGLTADSIVSHKEAHALGYASNHGDPENWLNRHGMTMDDFRSMVRDRLSQAEDKVNPYTEPTSLLRKGSNGDGVRWVQWELTRLGYDCGKIDGIFGAGTEAAVRALQKDSRIAVDGIVGPYTRAALKAAEKPKKPTTYTVVSGDSLSRIGKKMGVAWREIAKANGIKFPYIIRPGKVLVIPEV